MDYGHTVQPTNQGSDVFFTAGAGTPSTNINNVEPENNLDLTNRATTWDAMPANPDTRDTRNIGAGALASRESLGNQPVFSQPYRQEAPRPELGQIIDLEMPPMSTLNPAVNSAPAPSITEETPLRLTKSELFIGSSDKLSPRGLSLIKEEETKFRQGAEDISSFYDSIATIREESQSQGGMH